jgi:hypothetical protein
VNILTTLLHVTYPRQQLQPRGLHESPTILHCVVAVLHRNDHYTVMEINISKKRVIIYDGLLHTLLQWLEHIINRMKRCMLVGLNVTCRTSRVTTTGEILGRSREATNIVPGYALTLGSEEWRLERGEFIQQVDVFNCGPIACMKILELYSLINAHKVRLAHSTNLICDIATN